MVSLLHLGILIIRVFLFLIEKFSKGSHLDGVDCGAQVFGGLEVAFEAILTDVDLGTCHGLCVVPWLDGTISPDFVLT